MSDALNSRMVLEYEIDDLLRYMCALDTDISIMRAKINMGEDVSEEEMEDIDRRMKLVNERRDDIMKRMRVLTKRVVEDEKEG